MADSLILMVLALVVFGPRRLPQIGRQIGKLMYEFRKASNDFKFQMEEELRLAEEADRRKQEEQRRVQAAVTAQSTASTTDPAYAPYSEQSSQPAENATSGETQSGSGLRIQPPSTGEPVAAERPSESTGVDSSTVGAAAALDAIEQAADEHSRKIAAETSATQEQNIATELETPQSAPATEAASHNG